ncbi:hypothetical protein F4810DRAFT_404646 [Camillea tinctor]|nr:hypothetical protein F4810DRAFT_404646 [Camillea tinctor]
MEKSDLEEEKRKVSVASSVTMDEKLNANPNSWRGNLPCVRGHREGCFVHNPQNLVIHHNRRLPSEKKDPGFFEVVFGSREKARKHYTAKQGSELIQSNLPITHGTVDPLDPVHESVPYVLAWYHLNWVRSSESPQTMLRRLNVLVCSGEGIRRPDIRYNVVPFYHNNKFLLDQSIQFRIKMKERDPIWKYEHGIMCFSKRKKWHFQICPHTEHQFLGYDFMEYRGLIEAGVRYNTSCASQDRITKWRSLYGPKWLSWGCPKCCTDSDVKTELVGDEIVVSIRIYKDLGSGSNPFDKRWLAALRRKSLMERKDPEIMERTTSEIKRRVVVELVREAIEAKKKAMPNRKS